MIQIGAVWSRLEIKEFDELTGDKEMVKTNVLIVDFVVFQDPAFTEVKQKTMAVCIVGKELALKTIDVDELQVVQIEEEE